MNLLKRWAVECVTWKESLGEKSSASPAMIELKAFLRHLQKLFIGRCCSRTSKVKVFMYHLEWDTRFAANGQMITNYS